MRPAVHRLRHVVATLRAAVLFGLAGIAMLAAAISTASLRYAHCGPSDLAAVAPACRTGVRLLFGAYALLGVALVLGAASLALLWRDRRLRARRA